jgi:hypothetical protein
MFESCDYGLCQQSGKETSASPAEIKALWLSLLVYSILTALLKSHKGVARQTAG